MPHPSKKSILTAKHAPAIGELVLAISELESVVTDLISILAGSNILATLVMVHHQQTSSKLQNLLTLAHGHFGSDPETQPIISKIKEAQDVADFRNTVVHAYWTIDTDGTPLAVRFYARGEFKRTRRPISAEEIQGRADEARDLTQWLADLRNHLLKDTPEPHVTMGG